jgi:hypothetical protein
MSEEKQVLKEIKAFAKMLNGDKKALGLSKSVTIPPKATVEQAEEILNTVIESIEVQPSDEIIAASEELDAMIQAYKEEVKDQDSGRPNDGKIETEEEPPPPEEPDAESSTPKDDQPEDQLPDSAKKTEPKGTTVKKSATKAPAAKKKTTPVSEDHSAAIKKLYGLLSEDQIDNLDPATMRIILKSMK